MRKMRRYNEEKGEDCMKSAEAKAILELLVNGVDPVTGECLDDEHVCMQPLVMRALHCAIDALERRDVPAGSYPRREARLPANRPWTAEDDEQVRLLYGTGYTPEQICAVIDRRPRGLLRRMEYLGLFGDSARVSGMERAGTPWYPEDDEKLRQMFESGTDAGEIAAEMRRSRYSIACRLEKLGLIEDREQLRK